MRITFLIGDVHGMGGTIRSTVSLAGGLAQRHRVQIVSLARGAARPFFPVDPRVRLRSLTDSRAWAGRPEPSRRIRELELRPATLVPPTEARRSAVFNAATEEALCAFLARARTDVVVATRPGLNSLLALLGSDHYLRIGQEHLNLRQQTEDIRDHIRRHHARLDGLTVLTDADRRDYAALLDRPEGWAITMPNPLPDARYPRSRLVNPVIATAGRLIPVKQYPVLVQAFARVAAAHPEWQLRVYGHGPQRGRIRAMADELGLHGRVVLMGRTRDVTGEFAKASLVALSSRQEGFGMTIVEAFAVGVPVVSFDCPHGPRELIEPGRDGLLVPDQDVDALGAGLLRLVEDAAERQRMGAAAREKARRFRVDHVVRRWEEYLVERLG
ncbi:glycosyltransferase family 4 protein [Marinitenerispora sediminis]|uniref:Glycosyl hydrolase family 1 n=1 Tax=Marinitenerispora sediminis TaxID=1931232 RepID=A0A368T8Z5_9ACTN|nr:glycosyltransferase family 4 protein [Marinitenerispora sediminis]RCV55672.1 glycosyl hydrolase family 1 [Marinitenerispora sediminis]RCV57724.1 glycosyl hydrolase family 1 [Marinitenerispora sediminis]RCV60896.1 glycosyl hydrolase family 1 [Marinitenerispora sediminis]